VAPSDDPRLKAYEAGSELPARRENTDWRSVVPLVVDETRAQPDGVAIAASLSRSTAASRTSPDTVPAGFGNEIDVDVDVADATERRAMLRWIEAVAAGDSLPDVSSAVTRYERSPITGDESVYVDVVNGVLVNGVNGPVGELAR